MCSLLSCGTGAVDRASPVIVIEYYEAATAHATGSSTRPGAAMKEAGSSLEGTLVNLVASGGSTLTASTWRLTLAPRQRGVVIARPGRRGGSDAPARCGRRRRAGAVLRVVADPGESGVESAEADRVAIDSGRLDGGRCTVVLAGPAWTSAAETASRKGRFCGGRATADRAQPGPGSTSRPLSATPTATRAAYGAEKALSPTALSATAAAVGAAGWPCLWPRVPVPQARRRAVLGKSVPSGRSGR